MSDRLAFGVAASIGLAALGASLLIATSGGDLAEPGMMIVGPLAFLTCGMYIWRQQPNLTWSRLLLLTGVAIALSLALPGLVDRIAATAGSPQWLWLPVFASQVAIMLTIILAVATLGLIPDGQPHDAFERRAVLAPWLLLLIPVLALVSAPRVYLVPWQYEVVTGLPSPLYLPALAGIHAPAIIAYHVAPAVALTGILLLARRYRSAGGPVRKQLRLVLYGGVASVVAIAAALGLASVDSWIGGLVWYLPLAFVAASVMLAVTRHRFDDVGRTMRRWLGPAISIMGLIVTILVLSRTSGIVLDVAAAEAVLAIAVVATLWLLLLRHVIDLGIERVHATFARPQPATDIDLIVDGRRAPSSKLAEQLANTLVTIPSVAWAQVHVAGSSAATMGSKARVSTSWSAPIRHADAELGSFVCGSTAERPMSESERATAVAIAAQTAVAIESSRLATRVVHAEEAARRRIERDIHDGAQQSIVAHMTRLELAKRLVRNGELTETHVEDLQHGALGILDELRDLARGIHPSVLSDMGLTDAVEERAARMPMPVRIETPARIQSKRFPDEIESTAYFIICEAFANILKHAGARKVDVDIDSDVSFLNVAIGDDGRGFDPAATPFRGLDGLVDRVAALGGSLQVSTAPGRGTRVFASLPLELRA